MVWRLLCFTHNIHLCKNQETHICTIHTSLQFSEHKPFRAVLFLHRLKITVLKVFRMTIKETLLQTRGNLELCVKCLFNYKRGSVCCNEWKTHFTSIPFANILWQPILVLERSYIKNDFCSHGCTQVKI